ncbi:MAG: hypothetical protein CMK56_07790 [Proteobacteria bacterium]|nr:hypothetical protein [Pseudomonadota bacterium]|tara:strand:- start:716 stop:1405 length:690 start_codon:yes stop_codon:yes gene_type:complete
MSKLILKLFCFISFFICTTVFAGHLDEALNLYKSSKFLETVKLLKPLAEKGDAEAQSLLGWMYFRGEGVAKSNKSALQWYVLAAEKGNHGAQFNLGFMYHQGHGVPLDYSEAVRWYIKAREGGNVFAHYNLGLLIEEGKGIKENAELAFRLFLFSAQKGHPQSMGKIGHYYSQGEGVKIDRQLAYQWAFLASKQGDRLGSLVLEEVMTHLNPKMIEKLTMSAKKLLKSK